MIYNRLVNTFSALIPNVCAIYRRFSEVWSFPLLNRDAWRPRSMAGGQWNSPPTAQARNAIGDKHGMPRTRHRSERCSGGAASATPEAVEVDTGNGWRVTAPLEQRQESVAEGFKVRRAQIHGRAKPRTARAGMGGTPGSSAGSTFSERALAFHELLH